MDSKQLLLALEPEAAVLHCRQLTIDHFHEAPAGSMERITMSPGTKYLIVDAGGLSLYVFGSLNHFASENVNIV